MNLKRSTTLSALPLRGEKSMGFPRIKGYKEMKIRNRYNMWKRSGKVGVFGGVFLLVSTKKIMDYYDSIV